MNDKILVDEMQRYCIAEVIKGVAKIKGLKATLLMYELDYPVNERIFDNMINAEIDALNANIDYYINEMILQDNVEHLQKLMRDIMFY